MNKINQMKRYYRVPTLSIIVLALLATLFVPQATAAFRYLHEGMKIPDFNGIDITTNEPINSASLFTGDNLVIVVFWATWSDRSIEELEALKEIAQEYNELPLKILAVNVDNPILTPTRKAKISKIIVDLALPYPVIIDSNLDIYYQFGVIAVPSTAIADVTGAIRYGPAGYSNRTRDLIVDSILVLLGLKVDDTLKLDKGYTPNNKALRYYNLALNLYNKGLYKRALSNLDLALDNDSDFAAIHNLKGEINFANEDFEAALTEFTAAASLDTNMASAVTGMGKTHLKMDNIDDAITVLDKVIQFDNTFTPALRTQSQCYLIKNDFTKAAELLKEALALNPMDPVTHYYLGRVFAKEKNNEQAVVEYLKAFEIVFGN